MPIVTQRHYPEVQPVRLRVPSGADKNLGTFAHELELALRKQTQQINQELRIIVDQLKGSVEDAGNEIVGGQIDGTNTIFILQHAPQPAASLLLLNRTAAGPLTLLVQGQQYDYAVKSTIITIVNSAAIPAVGDQLVAWYRWIDA